jgi:hypothetical protein
MVEARVYKYGVISPRQSFAERRCYLCGDVILGCMQTSNKRKGVGHTLVCPRDAEERWRLVHPGEPLPLAYTSVHDKAVAALRR